jgi:hypothetical protein
MKLTALAPLVSCLLSFLAGLAYAGGFARPPAPRHDDPALASLCESPAPGAAPRRVEVRALPLPDGRVAHVVMVDEGAWE